MFQSRLLLATKAGKRNFCVKSNRKATLFCDSSDAFRILFRDGISPNFVHRTRVAHNIPELTQLVCLSSPDAPRKATTTFAFHFNLYKLKEGFGNTFIWSNELATSNTPTLFFSTSSHLNAVDVGYFQNVLLSESFRDLEDFARLKKKKNQTVRWGPRTDYQLILPTKMLPLDALIEVEIIPNTNKEYELTPFQIWSDLFREMVAAEVGISNLSQNPVVQAAIKLALKQEPELNNLLRIWSLLHGTKSTSEKFLSTSGSPSPDFVKECGVAEQFSMQWEKSVDTLLTSRDMQSLGLFLDVYLERKLAQAEVENAEILKGVTSKIQDLEQQLKRLRHVEQTLQDYLYKPKSN